MCCEINIIFHSFKGAMKSTSDADSIKLSNINKCQGCITFRKQRFRVFFFEFVNRGLEVF